MIKHSRPTIYQSDFSRINKLLQSANLLNGGIVSQFESSLAEFINRKFALATNCGTAALHLSLLSLGIGKGCEVIIPSFVCTALLNAINYTGAKPVICDIDRESYNLDVQEVKRQITKKTKAIILPHMFGCPARIDDFLGLDIPLIEDCAHTLGVSFKGRKVGRFGIISVFSFYTTKFITTGQGGMLLTDSSSLFGKAKDLNDYDQRSDYKARYNYKMSDPQAAFGLTQLRRVNDFIKRRRQIARYYDAAFSKYNIATPVDNASHIYYRYVIRINAPLAKFILRLKKKGIEAKPPVYKPLHQYLGLNKKSFPNTEEAFKTAVSLPIYPSLTDNQARVVTKAILESL